MTLSFSRNDLHLKRRFFHMMSGILIVAIAMGLPSRKVFVIALVILSAIVVSVELLRLAWSSMNENVLKIFSGLMREGEQTQVSGIAHYCIGCTLAAIVFPRSIALLSILYLAVGDPVAAIAGVKFGKHYLSKYNLDFRKSVEGSLGCFLICAPMTFGMTYWLDMTRGLPLDDRLFFSFLGGLAAMIGEILPLQTDDNLALPLLSGAFLWLMATLFNLIPGLYFIS